MPKCRLDAFPDRADVRDWIYQPHLNALPDSFLSAPARADVLNQGSEGACTGYALCAVIHSHLRARGLNSRVSPRMLYEMARRYDEWPGENYEGSSARGGMIGWVRHGVCEERLWPANRHGPQHLEGQIIEGARGTPGGAYYRVQHSQVRDMHAALTDTGILYCTLMVHKGWDEPGRLTVSVEIGKGRKARSVKIPVIKRENRAADGHAIAIVGYTREGFIIQNSWGPDWGANGLALLPYEDYILHATDVWVAQLGVPVAADLWTTQGAADVTGGMQRAARHIPLDEIRPFVLDLGNNGELSLSGRYWTTKEDVQRLFTDHIPQRAREWKKKRLLLYLHGGLNDEDGVARRIVAFRDVMEKNEIYPLHIMWETGWDETLRDIIADKLHGEKLAGGIRDWFDRFRKGLTDAKDRAFELTFSKAGRALWDEMKENGRLASENPDQRDGLPIAGMQLLAHYANASIQALPPEERARWEIHVVAHSAGSIFTAYLAPLLAECMVPSKTIQFLAPAVTVGLFQDRLVPLISRGKLPKPVVYLLSDTAECDDSVGPYGKSLLYLVSNAFEEKREMPLLGMKRYLDKAPQPSRDAIADVIVAGEDRGEGRRSNSDTHGGFDNDADTMNSVLSRILGRKPAPQFDPRDLEY